MPKYVVSPLIAEGQYEYILRINLTPEAQGKRSDTTCSCFTRNWVFVAQKQSNLQNSNRFCKIFIYRGIVYVR